MSSADARRAARNAGAIAAASIISKGVLFGWYIVLARALGADDYGVYGTVSSFIAIGTALVNFGMGPIVIRDVARTPALAGHYLSATLFVQTLLALLAYVLVTATAAFTGYPVDIQAFLALAGISLMVDILGNMTNDILLAQERMLASSIVTILHILLLVGLAALALALGWGLLGVYAATLLAGVGRSAALWTLVLRDGVRLQLPLDRTLARALLVNGAPLAISAFLALAYQHADKLMTTRLISTVETGYLSAAFVIIFGVVEMLNTTVLIAVFPMMSRYQGAGEAFGFMVGKLSFFTLLVSLPLALALSIFAHALIVPLFGPNFAPTAEVLRVLIWYALISMLVNVLAQAMVVQNRQRRLLGIRAAGLATNITLNALLIIPLGIFGAAGASLLAELLVLVALLWIFQSAGWSLRHTLAGWLRLAALALIVAGVMVTLGAIHVIIGLTVGLLIYVVGCRYSLGADDWDLLYRLVAAMPGGGLIRRYWRRDTALNW